jgi:hypothetical protein
VTDAHLRARSSRSSGTPCPRSARHGDPLGADRTDPHRLPASLDRATSSDSRCTATRSAGPRSSANVVRRAGRRQRQDRPHAEQRRSTHRGSGPIRYESAQSTRRKMPAFAAQLSPRTSTTSRPPSRLVSGGSRRRHPVCPALLDTRPQSGDKPPPSRCAATSSPPKLWPGTRRRLSPVILDARPLRLASRSHPGVPHTLLRRARRPGESSPRGGTWIITTACLRRIGKSRTPARSRLPNTAVLDERITSGNSAGIRCGSPQ